MQSFRPIWLLLLTSLCLPSCVVFSPVTFDELEPGATMTRVTDVIGAPNRLVGEIVNAFGQRVSVLEYEKKTSLFPPTTSVYWVYFADGRYVKFSPVEDWAAVSKELYRTDFLYLPK